MNLEPLPVRFGVTRRHATLLSLGAAVTLVERCLAAPTVWPQEGHETALQSPPENAIRVLDFGARGDGETDDTAAIIAADTAAAEAGRPLFFSIGTYSTGPIKARASWFGAGSAGSVLRYNGHATNFVNMVSASGVDSIRFVDLGFDGNVSPDPQAWTKENHDQFTGAAGLSIDSCRDAVILRCRVMNTRTHGFRFLKVRGGRIEDCSTRRSRGIYGDGFLILSSSDILALNCTARDYTRIGVVADRTDVTEPLCQRITLRNCNPEQGHNASVLYGGTEFNAGVWIENCTSAVVDGVNTRYNVHRGISVCSGKKTSDFTGDYATIVVRECTTSGGEFGICVYSLADLPIKAMVTHCSVRHALIAFQGVANTGQDSVTWTNCHADYDASAGNGRGFSTEVTSAVKGMPSFTIGKGCTISRWAEDPTKLADAGANAATADIGGYYNPAGPMRMNVEGVRQTDGKPIFIRWYNSQAHDVHVSDVNAYISRGSRAGTKISARNATVRTRPTDTAIPNAAP